LNTKVVNLEAREIYLLSYHNLEIEMNIITNDIISKHNNSDTYISMANIEAITEMRKK